MKAMLFIDGTWLRHNSSLGNLDDQEKYHLDYGNLPSVLAELVATRLRVDRIDVARTHFFGSHPINYDSRDDHIAKRWCDFFCNLKRRYHFEVKTFPLDFKKHRIRPEDRDHNVPFKLKEKCVDIALAVSMLSNAFVDAYDIAIVVLGDRDYVPVLQYVRDLGKRVAIASVIDSCAQELADPWDKARVKDFDVIWLNNLREKLRSERIGTTIKGVVNAKFAAFKRTTDGRIVPAVVIRSDQGRSYYFDAFDANLSYKDLKVNTQVKFEIVKLPFQDDYGKKYYGDVRNVSHRVH